MRDILKLGIVLMLYSVTAGALLAVVYIQTAPIIAANREAASNEALDVVLPGMDGGFVKQETVDDFQYWIGYTDNARNNPGGYVFTTSQQGYSSEIETMVGVDADGEIVGVEVLSQQETAGLGDRVTEPGFKDQFVGIAADDDVALAQDGGSIDAISGATISSRAMTLSIRNGLNRLNAELTGEEFEEVEMEVSEEPAAEEETFELPDDETVIGVMPGMITTVELVGGDTEFPYWIGYFGEVGGRVMGYAFIAAGEGFASTVRTLVGVDTDYTISGVEVLSQNETPGYGTRIVEEVKEGESEPWFMRQFVGKSPSDSIALASDGGEIDALSEATITSRAVTGSIDEELDTLRRVVSGEIQPEEIEAAPEEASAATETSIDEETVISVMPGMITAVEQVGEDTGFPYWIGYFGEIGGRVMGYAFVAEGEGFASTIRTLVGVDPDGVISGMKIVSQDETPGYGTRLVEETKEGESEPWFPRQFIGKSPDDSLALSGDGGVIDGLSGATVSSKAVTESVAEGLETLMSIVRGEAEPPAKAETESAPEAAEASAPAGPPVDDETVIGVMPGMVTAVDYVDTDTELPYWVGYFGEIGGRVMGYAFVAEGEGFASTIRTLVGVDPDGVISGMKIVSQDETPGYGTRLVEETKEGESEPWFPRQFIGKSLADSLKLSGDGGVIDGLSGATVSSKAVTEPVAEGLGRLMQKVE